MTKQELDEIEALANAATDGPWQHVIHYDTSGVCNRRGETLAITENHWPTANYRHNCEFIAHARQDIPDLVAEVRRLRTEVSTLESDIVDLGYELTEANSRD